MGEKIDVLNRQQFVDDILKIVNQLSENEKGCCFAVEGTWGIGKTFVLEAIEEQLGLIQSEKTNSDRYFVFHYNCWKYDYYDEPAVAIVSAMLDCATKETDVISTNVKKYLDKGWKIAKEKLLEIAGVYIENKIGVNLCTLFEENDAETDTSEVNEMFNFGKTIEEVREKLQAISEEKTIVLVVDELDRCIPQYAIKVMERLHHIFYGLEKVIVIMAIDRRQLEHSVEEMFGNREGDNHIDIERYLKKFIDFSLSLNSGEINASFMEKYKYIFDKFNIKDSSEAKEIGNWMSVLFKGIDVRRQEKIMDKIAMIHSIVCSEQVDVSVLVFEIFYEVLQAENFGELKDLVYINNHDYVSARGRITEEKIALLKDMEANAWHGIIVGFGYERKNLENNLSARLFWYFAKVFNSEKMPYSMEPMLEEKQKKLVEIVMKYYQFSKIIR